MFYDQCILIKNKVNRLYYRKIDYICVRFYIEFYNQYFFFFVFVVLRMGSFVSIRAGEKKQNWLVLQTIRNGRSWILFYGIFFQFLCSKYILVCFLIFFELFFFMYYKDYCFFILYLNVIDLLNVYFLILYMLMLFDVIV